MARRTKHLHFWRAAFAGRGLLWWLLMPMPLAILAALVTLRDSMSLEDRSYFHLDYLPTVRTHKAQYLAYFLSWAIIVILYVVPKAVNAVVQNERERTIRTLHRYQERMRQPPRPHPETDDVVAESYITPGEQAVVWAYRNEQGFIISSDETNATLRALVVPYKNQRNHPSFRRVGDISDVSGEVSWVNYDYDQNSFRVNPGPVVWLSDERERLPFRRDSAAHRMVLAVFGLSDTQALSAVQRQSTTLGKQVTETPLVGDRWRVRVALFARSESKALRRSDVIIERDGHSYWDGCPEG